MKRKGRDAMQEWQQEQQRVNEVTKKIRAKAAILEKQTGTVRSEVTEIRQNFWEDVTVNFDNAEEAAETHASIKQQAEMLAERERSHHHYTNQLKLLRRLMNTPYFGRIDFAEEGEPAEAIYLGIGSFYDEEQEEFLIYDWRAPISSVYYDYAAGPAAYTAPSGTVHGTLQLKRQFVIRNAQIEGMFDTGVTIGDVMLQEVLGKQSNTQMKNIVATIQKEQNLIIRNESSRLLIVQGAAGSGKTSAALQRVAYLLYRYRGSLRADQMILFSPNPLFNSYVSTVLPELGEENMQQTTFQDYLAHQVTGFTLEDPFTQLEYMLRSNDAVRRSVIRYKAELDFMKLIDSYAAHLQIQDMRFTDIKFRGTVLLTAREIAAYFYSVPVDSLPSRMEETARWIKRELKKHEKRERTRPWVEEEMELLDKDTLQEAYETLQSKQRYSEHTFNDFEREQALLRAIVVRKHFKKLYVHAKKLRFADVPAIYAQLFAPGFAQFTDQLPANWQDICDYTTKELMRRNLPYEDATPFIYLKEQIEGFRRNTSMRHIFIDEAQDYAPFQFAFLKRLFPLAKMTVLGDLNQAIHAQSAHVSLFTLSSLYDQSETIELTRSYRSTKQIIEFTRQFVDGGERIEAFQREGALPVVEQVPADGLPGQIATRIAALQGAGHQNIAVICKTAHESKQMYQQLQPLISLRLITKETSSFEPGVSILPSYLAKGVEFDAVIVCDAAADVYGEQDGKLFYTVCTRAMHELHIFTTKQITPLLRLAKAETYENRP
jgi:DNA helicase-2/ATP-dependent DNA helicase PcrA